MKLKHMKPLKAFGTLRKRGQKAKDLPKQGVCFATVLPRKLRNDTCKLSPKSFPGR